MMWKKIRCRFIGHFYERVGEVITHTDNGGHVTMFERDLDCKYCDKKITETINATQ